MRTCFSTAVLTALQVALFISAEARVGGSNNEYTLMEENQHASNAEHSSRNLVDSRSFSTSFNSLDKSDESDEGDNNNYTRVMVGYRNENGRRAAHGVMKKWILEMKHSRVATMVISKESIESLRSHPHIEFVEEDGLMTLDDSDSIDLEESIPFGISMITGNSTIIPTASRGASSSCSHPDSFKVAIIDSGLEVGHPDIPCLPNDHPETNCKGISIGIDEDAFPWHKPKGKAGHGTHIFGIIGAVGGNGEGVSGMVPNSDGICYLIARVVDDEGHGSFASSTFHALDWAVGEGASVINMSLSAKTYFQAGEVAVTSAHEHGALVVASVGNFGLEEMRYPAGFDHVIGVAAVTDDGERASFSQHNDKVDVAAPGVAIRSTYLDGGYATMNGTSAAAPHVAGAIARVWSACRQCSNAKVERCLVSTASSAASGRNNEIGFGVVNAADTYDCLVHMDGCCAENILNEAGVNGNFDTTTPSGGILSIWLDKVAATDPQPAEVAPPHTSQEIAKLWSVCRQCSNAQIENCLLTTAMDAPSNSYDSSSDIFHAADTYDCLVNTIGCCA
jgi:hypothetical protein